MWLHDIVKLSVYLKFESHIHMHFDEKIPHMHFDILTSILMTHTADFKSKISLIDYL